MLTLFFVEDLPTAVGSTYEFTSDDALHAIRVLRIKSGDFFNLSDGKGNWSHVEAKEVHKKHMTVEVIETGHQEALDTHFTVIQAIPKGDRIKERANEIFEWTDGCALSVTRRAITRAAAQIGKEME